MSENQFEPAGLRARLLDVEPLDSQRLLNLQQEIDTMFVKKLNPAGRAAWFVSLVISSVFGIGGVYTLFHPRTGDPSLGWAWAATTLVLLANAVFALSVLIRGQLNLRSMIGLHKALPPAMLILSLALVIYATTHPDPRTLARAAVAIIWLVVSLAITLYGRIVTAELNTREAMLRLELRLAESTERRTAV